MLSPCHLRTSRAIQYEISYLDCKSLEELINRIETTLLEFDDCEELESISLELSSRNYYLNTNK